MTASTTCAALLILKDCTAAALKMQRDAARLLLDWLAANKKADKKPASLTGPSFLIKYLLIDTMACFLIISLKK